MHRSPTPKYVAHVAIWTPDIETLRAFYVEQLGASAGPRYHNPRTGFNSYMVSFRKGARVELMSRPDVDGWLPADARFGYAHLALSLGGPAAFDEAIAALAERGVVVVSAPRLTGDGYYEAVIQDPDGNLIELIA
jgi:lactoylglutathione lyase